MSNQGCARDQGTTQFCAEAVRLQGELDAANESLRFIERWVNHHGGKNWTTPEGILSMIQHYPPILAITRSYKDGKVPETPNPWAALDAANADRERLRAELEAVGKWLKDPRWGTYPYMEGSDVYEDKSMVAASIRLALAASRDGGKV